MFAEGFISSVLVFWPCIVVLINNLQRNLPYFISAVLAISFHVTLCWQEEHVHVCF